MRSTIFAIALLAACEGRFGTPSSGPIALRGRVVDAESCAAETGCVGLSSAVVYLRSDPILRSEVTGADGTFEVTGIPSGFAHDFVVAADGSELAIAPTINPRVIAPDDRADLFGVELYALPTDARSLLAVLREEEGIDLERDGGYVGQAVRVAGSSVTAADGVRAMVFPTPALLRFVNVLPRFVEEEPVLLPLDAVETGPFGSFVVETQGPVDQNAFAVLEDGYEYELVVAPTEPGFVTYAIQRGEAR
jgi:hypothetical protein